MGSTPIPTFPHRKGEGVKKAICIGSFCPAPGLWVRISLINGDEGGFSDERIFKMNSADKAHLEITLPLDNPSIAIRTLIWYCLFMEYISTRGSVPPIASKKAIIKGIAEDNGLYVPSSFPFIGPNPFAALLQKSYAARAEKVLQLFLTDFTAAEIRVACKGAYADNFDSPLTAPVQFLDHGTAVLELWHGPTLAFKDIALQLMPRLLSMALQGEQERYKVVILVATSGDTGKAALEGFADAEGVSLFVFYPHKGVSEMQRLQMVTQRGGNVGACGVIGNFDDAQTGVKKIFSEPEINGRLETFHLRLSSANSINWGRLAPQVV